MATHDLTARVWGKNYSVMDVESEGRFLRLSVWSPRPLREDDFLLLRDGQGQPTRYQVLTVERKRDPSDQYFVRVVFMPRIYIQPGADERAETGLESEIRRIANGLDEGVVAERYARTVLQTLWAGLRGELDLEKVATLVAHAAVTGKLEKEADER